MGIFFGSFLIEGISFLLILVWFLHWYFTKNYNYWKKRNVVYKKPQFPFGSVKDVAMGRTFIGKAYENIYKEFPNERFYGIIEFREPVLVIKDPEIIKQVMVKDFNHFMDRSVLVGNPKEYIMKSLLSLVGQEWKDMRAKLTPTFSSGKLKLMFSLMEICGEKLKEQLEIDSKDDKTVDAKNILARFTLEMIASCAFGLETNSISEENSEFYKRLGGTVTGGSSPIRFLRRLLFIFFPSLIKTLRINVVKRDLTEFITNIVRDTVEYRKKNGVKRNDFVDLLINIKQNKSEWMENGHSAEESTSEGLTVEQMAAQTFVFFIAGFETASSLMSFCLFELSCNKDIQEKLYQEVKEAVEKNGGKISYQVLSEIPYLDQVIDETLRLYGTAHTLSRKCTKAFNIPDSDVVVEKGIKVTIPLYALHHDPKYFPDPYTFNPDRFSAEQSKGRHPYVFMPFGEGPRNCIGMRFGLMQAKVGLATVILNFHVELSPEQEVPIDIHKRTIVILPANPVRLKFYKRS